MIRLGRLICLLALLGTTGCQTRPPPTLSLESINVETLRRFLSARPRVGDVTRLLGSSHESGGGHLLFYKTPAGEGLTFTFIGDFITAALLGSHFIEGEKPRIHRMMVSYDFRKAPPILPEDVVNEADGTQTISLRYLYRHWYSLDGRKYYSYEEFRARLRTLPRDSVVEWSLTDVRVGGIELPLDDETERAAFVEFCRQIGITLMIDGGG